MGEGVTSNKMALSRIGQKTKFSGGFALSKTNLKPHLLSNIKMVKGTDDFDVYLFIPSLLRAFPFKLEKVSLANRIRYVIEFFAGYEIFYIQKNGVWGGVLHSF